MDISFQSLLFFILITMIYFAVPSIGKPTLTLADLADGNIVSMSRLALYLGAVVVSQLFLNIGYLMATCGGSLDSNIGSASLYTLVPWTLMFGVLMAILVIFPGFKGAFSNVIGYAVVSGMASDLFTTMFMDPNANPDNASATEAILKIYGNKSILINQLNPGNFLEFWETLKPLMKPEVRGSAEIQQQLLDVVALKENVGEAVWYVYAAILISSIVYYNLATRGCVKSVEQIKAEHDKYVQQQEASAAATTVADNTVYVQN